MDEAEFRFPTAARVKNAVYGLATLGLAGVGVYYLAAYHPSSVRGWLFPGIVTAFFAFAAFNHAYQESKLSQRLITSASGIRIVRWGKDFLSIPWSEIREVRDKGALGGVTFRTTVCPAAIEVNYPLENIKAFRAVLQDKVGKW